MDYIIILLMEIGESFIVISLIEGEILIREEEDNRVSFEWSINFFSYSVYF